MTVLASHELRQRAEQLSLEPHRWSHLVRHDSSQRVFEQVVEAPELEGWLICWMPGHDTGFHDHDLSSGAVIVIGGEVREDRLRLPGTVVSNVYGPGDVFDFSASDIHRVTHFGVQPAVTLHVYSPRLRRLGAYAVARDGELQRHPLSYGEELRPLVA